jgi:hypothetical protein
MPVKDQKSYKFSQSHLEPLLQQLFREAQDNFAAIDKDGDLVINRDIHCRSLFVDDESLYIGGVKLGKPAFDEDGYYLKYDRATSKFTYNQKAIPIDEDVQDIAGAMFSGNTETFITATYQDADGTIDLVVPVKDEDDMASNSNAHLPTQQSAKAYTENTAIAMAVALGMP